MKKEKVNEELIRRFEKNSRLRISEKEAKEFVPQLQAVIDSFSKLDKLDVSKAKPSFQPIELKNVMAKDEVAPSLSQEEALSNTHHKKDGYFKGPKVV